MKCPKCKTEVSSKDVICKNCGSHLVVECPKCKKEVRLGSASCKSCGYVFVKFCPSCNSANYLSSPTCRKCFHVFEDVIKEEPKIENNSNKNLQNENKQTSGKKEPLKKTDNRLDVFVDFMNLTSVFQKFKDNEFKNKVLLNIKTSVKLAFNSTPEFYKESCVKFKVPYNKNNGIYSKIEKFNSEISKFNTILTETLGAQITHKFIILAPDEFEPDKTLVQLAMGEDFDIITSKAAYEILKDELSLVKVSPDSYKMINLHAENNKKSAIKETDEKEALEILYKGIVEENQIKGLSFNAPRGTGKTYVINKLYEKLNDSDIAILASRCSAMSQVAPMGLFQDVFLNLFNLPFAPVDYEQTTNKLRALIQKYVPLDFEKEKTETLINLLYPQKEAFYEELEINKKIVFSHIKDILEALRANTRVLISIDDFDLIDETSFEFLIYLIQENFFVDESKFLICYRNQNSLNMYIPEDILPKKNCFDIALKRREIGSTRAFIKKNIGDVSILPRKIADQIIMNAKGDLAYAGQVLYHLIETKKLKLNQGVFVFQKEFEDYFIPQNMSDIMEERLKFLLNKSKLEFVLLNMASFMGGRFDKTVFRDIIDTEPLEIDNAFASLEAAGYISKIDDDTFSFKNSLLWTNIYIYAKNNIELKPYVEALLKVLEQRKVSSPAICALLAQIAQNREEAFELWTKNLKVASAIGDTALYIMSQKQSFANLEVIEHPSKEYIKNNIYERLGKLSYKKNPSQAVEYLSNAIVEAKNNSDFNKIIELSGYLLQSCKLAQKYTAVIETADNILSFYNEKQKSEPQSALIKTRKLDALIHTGCYEEAVNIVNSEVNPVLSDILKSKKKLSYISRENIYKAWLEANISLIEAYSYQGNPLAFELMYVVEKEIFKDKNNVDIEMSKKFKLACALAYSAKGILNQSDEILHTLIKEFSKEDGAYISKWNMITLFNKILRCDFENIKEDLFEAVTFANNNGDIYTKNILKTILAYVIMNENDSLKALEICQEQMDYFSREKVALGALITWFISAKATLKVSGADKAIEICEKSIQIAESIKINSVWFKVLFQIFMANCYATKGDLESAKMYTELAAQDVNQNELNYFMLGIVKLRALIMQDTIDKAEAEKKAEIALATAKMHEKAVLLAKKLGLEIIHYKFQKDYTSFKASCKLKRVPLSE